MATYDYSYHGTEDYCYPGTEVLKNKLNIKDNDALMVAERRITSIKLLMLYNQPVQGDYDLEHLCKIHKIIFGDIYSWAGQTRKGEFLTKGGSLFCRGSFIKESADTIFNNLKKENHLRDMSKNSFIERVAYYMGEINALHPFREGNGRTSREYFRQLCFNANYILDFSAADKDELLEADILAFNGQYDTLVKILARIVNSGNSI